MEFWEAPGLNKSVSLGAEADCVAANRSAARKARAANCDSLLAPLRMEESEARVGARRLRVGRSYQVQLMNAIGGLWKSVEKRDSR